MKNFDDNLKESIALFQEIENQTDRGAAIVGVAWVEEELLAAIQSFLQKDKKAWDRLFGRSGSLSTFSAKIDMARLLGIVDEEIASDLHRLRKIRNEFAHSVLGKNSEAPTFNTIHIRDMCFSIRCSSHEEDLKPRARFLRACAILNSSFYLFKLSNIEIENHSTIHAPIRY